MPQQHQQQIEQPQQQQQQQLSFPPGIAPPPGLTQNKNSIFPPHGPPQPQQLANNAVGSGGPTQKPGTPRIPPGFSMNMLPQHMNAQQQASQLRQNLGNMMNMPHPMNNFPVSISRAVIPKSETKLTSPTNP